MHNQSVKACEDGIIRPRLFLGENVPLHFIKALESLGCEVRLLPPCESLPMPVSTHADMLLCEHLGTLFLPLDYYQKNAELFSKVNVAPLNGSLMPSYPWDVRLNALIMADMIVGRTDVIFKEVLDRFEKRVFVKQGYAACSTLVISDSAAVTADKSIANALEANGVDVCMISSGHIALEGYSYGFIGGAGVRVFDDLIAFFGDLDAHPDGEKIAAFAQKHKVGVISLSKDPLTDYGGGKRIIL